MRLVQFSSLDLGSRKNSETLARPFPRVFIASRRLDIDTVHNRERERAGSLLFLRVCEMRIVLLFSPPKATLTELAEPKGEGPGISKEEFTPKA